MPTRRDWSASHALGARGSTSASPVSSASSSGSPSASAALPLARPLSAREPGRPCRRTRPRPALLDQRPAAEPSSRRQAAALRLYGEVEVVLPRRAVVTDLPAAGDRRAVGAEGAAEPLGELERRRSLARLAKASRCRPPGSSCRYGRYRVNRSSAGGNALTLRIRADDRDAVGASGIGIAQRWIRNCSPGSHSKVVRAPMSAPGSSSAARMFHSPTKGVSCSWSRVAVTSLLTEDAAESHR